MLSDAHPIQREDGDSYCDTESAPLVDHGTQKKPDEEEMLRLQKAGGWFRKRFVVTTTLMFGLVNVYAMRVNLSEAVEPMQKHYNWSNITQGYVLSAFFWGYILFQIPGAWLASKYGGKYVFGAGVFGTSVLTLIVPFCASRLWLLLTVRALMGLCESVTYPALNVLFTQWVPCTERSFHVAFTTAGAYLGTAIAFPVSGVLIDLHHDDDDVSTTWPYVFYVFGACGLLWCFVWQFLGESSPGSAKHITADERRYLALTTGCDADVTVGKLDVVKSDSPPWRGFLTHPAAWAIYINHFSANLSIYTLMTYLPKYMKEDLGFDLKSAGGIAVIPYLMQFLGSIGSGFVADWMIKFTTVKRTRLTIELVSFGICISALCVTGWMTDTTLAVVTVSIAVGASGMTGGGFSSNYIDVSPHYAGYLFSVGNVIANTAGIIAPILAGYILGDAERSPGEASSDSSESYVPASHWRNVFYVSAGVYFCAGVVWVLFMSGKPVKELN